MLATFHGTPGLRYPDFIDAATGRMLEPEPGGTYDVKAAPGRHPGLPDLPGDGRWAAVPDAPPSSPLSITLSPAVVTVSAPAPDPAAEPATDPEGEV